jgi:hypothetical protein
VCDLVDPRRTRSRFVEPSQVFPTMEPLLPIYCYMILGSDPQSYAVAKGNPHREEAMKKEYNSLIENNTWEWVPLPSIRKLVRCKWIFNTKRVVDGYITKYKARLVVKGFSRVQGIYYEETFASVAKIESIWLAIAIATTRKWEVHHMDVKNTFLYGDLNEEIYMEKPEGYVQDPSLVCRLMKSLYELKQVPQAWYAKMDSYLLSRGFLRCRSNPNVYMMRNANSLLLIVLYVDDLPITRSSTSSIAVVKTALHDRFSMIDMGLLHYFLGLEINQNDSGIKMSQTKYAKELLDRFQMTDCKPAPTPF